MFSVRKFALLGYSVLLIAACSDDIKHVTEIDQSGTIPVISTGDSLPGCTADEKGNMIYIEDSLSVYFCNNNQWLPVKGESGANGSNGKDGLDGTDGESCTVKPTTGGFKVLCNGDSVGVLLNGSNGERGDQGEKGNQGESCTVSPTEKGYDILCGGVSVGTLSNGVNGEKGDVGEKGDQGEKGETGEKGNQGEKGDDGKSCTVKPIDNGYEVFCDNVSMGTLMNGTNGEKGDQGEKGDDCTLTDNNDGTVTQRCGDESIVLYKALCGTNPYDPAGLKFCYGVTLYDKCDGKAYDVKTQHCVENVVTNL